MSSSAAPCPFAGSRRSALLSTTTTFLPHSWIERMKVRSDSEIGRSDEVTNSTRSQRGMIACVISAWLKNGS
jgi:hypothetical protein